MVLRTDCRSSGSHVESGSDHGQEDGIAGGWRGTGLQQTIADACRILPPVQRRGERGKLLSRAGRWKERRDILAQVASPEEAADVMWWIKFELPGRSLIDSLNVEAMQSLLAFLVDDCCQRRPQHCELRTSFRPDQLLRDTTNEDDRK